jgi:predicted ATPase
LAKSVQKTKQFDNRGIFLLGKFDQAKTGQEPYAAFVTAFQQFVGCLLDLKNYAHGENLFKALQVELTSELSPLEWAPLVQPFPELQELLHSVDEKEEAEQSSTKRRRPSFLPDPDQGFQVRRSSFMDSGTPEKDKSRFRNSFRQLVRVISKHFSPMVLVLDDLQWTDFASLDLVVRAI